MFIQQPYDSVTLSKINKNEITSLVNRYITLDYAYIAQNENLLMKSFKRSDGSELRPVYLFGVSNTEDEIPPLDFPFMDPDGKWICFDMRHLFTADRNTKTFKPKRSMELEFIETRNQLTGIWCAGNDYNLSLYRLPHLVFGDWVAKLIASRFGLDLMEEAYISILGTIYYSRMFNNPIDEAKDLEILKATTNKMNYSPEMVDTVYQLSKEMFTLEDFCEHVYKITDNVRVKGFGVGVLYRITQSSWMGVGNQQNLSIALEYPPIWIAMVYCSLKDNVYNKTTIGNIAVKLGRRGDGDAFIGAVTQDLRTLGALRE